MGKTFENRTGGISTIKLSFFISLTYVVGATIVCYLDGYNHYLPPILGMILYFVFFPAIVFPNLILYAEGDGVSSLPYMLVCQTITLIGICLFIYVVITVFRKIRK